MTAYYQRPEGCFCDYNPDTTNGPEEFCPHHGRSYSDLVEMIERQAAEIERLRGQGPYHHPREWLVEDWHGKAKGIDG